MLDRAFIKRAKDAMLLRPSFKLCGTTGDRGSNIYKSKVFLVKCLDCGSVEARSLEWINSRYGCLCQRGRKISASSSLTAEEFSTKWNLEKRRIALVSEYKTMHIRVVAKCLRCTHVWDTAPTNLRHAGCPKCAQKLKQKACMRKYGVAHHTQRPEVRKRTKQTFLNRYGVTSALQDRAFLDKMVQSSYRRKEYRLGSRTVLVQGYEPYALDYIVDEKRIKPGSVRCGLDADIPSIPYVFNGACKVYHPDIFIPRLNLLVEVKSSYTYRRSLEKNLAKKKACEKLGYTFKFLVFKKNGELHAYSDR